jgi:hypothetical protein
MIVNGLKNLVNNCLGIAADFESMENVIED